MQNDISSIQDIKLLVDTFYHKVQKDDLIGGIFHSAIKDWQPHLEKMYRFWETILLDVHSYTGSPFPPHAFMPLEAAHFERWLALWTQTVDAHFAGEKAAEAKWRAEKMAQVFLSKITYLRNQEMNS